MNLILHQFKTDWRHFYAGVLGLWALFAAQLALAGAVLDLSRALGFLLLFLKIIFGAVLLARIIQADPLAGSSAQWLTRPLRRPQLFWAKSAFLFVCLLAPGWIPQLLIGKWHHYTFDMFLASGAGWWLLNLAGAGFLAALAALTPDLPRFFLMLGVFLAGFFVSAAAFVFRGSRDAGSPHSSCVIITAVIVDGLLLSGCALLVWIWQYRTSRSWPGLGVLGLGVLALPWMLGAWTWNGLAPRRHLLPPLPLTSLDGFAPPGDLSEGQVLWSEFLLTGLPPHSLVVAEAAQGTFQPDGQEHAYRLALPAGAYHGGGDYYWRGRALPTDSFQAPDYWAVIRGFFPPETLWIGQPARDGGGVPRADELFKKFPGHPLPGRLDCQLALDEFSVAPVVRVPLRPGAWTVAPGIRVVVHSLTPQPAGVMVDLEEIQATPLLSRKESYADTRVNGASQLCTYVLYHPDSGEADVLDRQAVATAILDFLDGELHQSQQFLLPYPILQERLAGVSLRDYLDKASLCVFVPVYQGTHQQPLRQDHCDLSRIHYASPDDADDQKSLEFIRQTLLSPSPTAAQTTEYLDAILQHLPDNPGEADRRTILSRLEAIGSRGLPLLLARLPLEVRTESDYVFPLLTKLATREQLPELREALGRDLRLADWFQQMNWADDARDILLARLGDHRRTFPPVALGLAAAARNPATYPDLTWHFVRLAGQQARVAAVLAQCPGFDLAGAVREAWSRVRLGLSPAGELALLAAQQGVADAFNQVVIQLERSQDSPLHRQDQARQIAALTDYKGADDTAPEWLSAHLGRFEYDAAARRYRVRGSQ
jgi:hypothetical protein